MTKRDDMAAALEGRQPEGAVPFWELEFHAWNAFSAVPLILGEEFANLTPAEQESALFQNADIILSVAEALHFAAVTVPGNYWRVAPGVWAYYILPDDARYRQIQILQNQKPDDLMLVAGSGGVMAMPAADEYLEFSYALYDSPDEIDARAQRALQNGLANARRLRDLGVEAVFTASDIADNHGIFFTPAQMERYIWPYLRTWAEQVKALGLYAILHTDGDLTRGLETIAASGLHALQAIDPVAGMDIVKVKAQIGEKICLCGNLDCGLLVAGSVESIKSAARDLLISCKHAGGFVFGSSNAVQIEVPKENYLAMVQSWEEYGEYNLD